MKLLVMLPPQQAGAQWGASHPRWLRNSRWCRS